MKRWYEVFGFAESPPRFPTSEFNLLILLFASSLAANALSAARDSYSEHCSDLIPEPGLLADQDPLLIPRSLALRHAHVGYRGNETKGPASAIPSSLIFSARRAFKTQKDGIFKIEASLSLTGDRPPGYRLGDHGRRGLRLVHFRQPRIPVGSGDSWNSLRYTLSGFWDWSSGKLCMVGSGAGNVSSENVVLRLHYLNSSNIFNSFVNGTFQRFDVNVNGNGFIRNPMSILGVNLRQYKYELIDKEITNNGFDLLHDSSDVSLGVEDLDQNLCLYVRTAGSVELKYMNDCGKVNCNFLGGENANYTPSFMNFNEIECLEDGKVRFLLEFGDSGQSGYQLPFEPNVTLVSEGKWDVKRRRLNMVGCRIFSDWDDGFVGDCLIRLSLRFPSRWTLKERSSLVGLMWSSRSVNESGYFSNMSLTSAKNKNVRAVRLKYEYTEIESVKSSCAGKLMQKSEGEFPEGLSSDLRFDMVARNRDVKGFWGYSTPLYVEDRFYQTVALSDWDAKSRPEMNLNHTGMVNVSYVLSLVNSRKFKLSGEHMQINSFDISAEGLYNLKSGHLCMVGCMHIIESPIVKRELNSSLDCDIRINIQYPPIHSKERGTVKGTIESTREKSDRFYFEPFEIFSSSIYFSQAKESMWRMDLEITMVVVSNTLLCLFVSLQLWHVKKNADGLPFISIVMLFLLTLAHMIPLLLNFEALFLSRHSANDAYFPNDGWVEVNEVLVRVITMIAFLLEFRLLQMSWCAKSSHENQKNIWTSDKKVLCISLPVYTSGALIACLTHLSKNSHPKPSFRISQQKSIWGDLKSYGGLILDGFLLPQILLNLFCNTREKALTPSFYAGTTFVRLMPHAYDLYRSYTSDWSVNYMYADPRMDYYSPSWDIVISTVGLLFVLVIFLQQRYGGGCLLPKGLRHTVTYEKLPVATGE